MTIKKLIEKKLEQKTALLRDEEGIAHRTMGVYNHAQLNDLRVQVELLKELKREIDNSP